jgi:hypothetical protein
MKSTRSFELHGEVFNLLVEKQSGTLAKAVTELVMNAIDAESPKVDIRITPTCIEVDDRGHGFRDEVQIREYFSTLGTPHEEGDAVYGRYRMGRAQSLRWGVVKWRSNTFEMEADARNMGQGHIIRTNLAQRDGCIVSIKLHEKLSPQAVRELVSTMSEWVRWVSVPIFVNGDLASTDPSSLTNWTIADDECFVRLDDRPSLEVYNKGIFVTSMGAAALGSGGCISSVQTLDLVYSRNAIKESCPIWRSIKKKIRALTRDNARTRGMNSEQRAHYRAQLSSGTLSAAEAITDGLRLFTLVDGTHVTLERFAELGTNGMACAPAEDAEARCIHSGRLASILDSEVPDSFGAAGLEDLVEQLTLTLSKEVTRATVTAARDGRQADAAAVRVRRALEALEHFKLIDIDPLRKAIRADARPIRRSLLPPAVRAYISALDKAAELLPGRPKIAACNTRGMALALGGGTLFVNPPMLPDPTGGLPSLLRTAAMLAAACVPQTEASENYTNHAVRRAMVCSQSTAKVALALLGAFGDQAKHGNSRALKIQQEAMTFNALKPD